MFGDVWLYLPVVHSVSGFYAVSLGFRMLVNPSRSHHLNNHFYRMKRVLFRFGQACQVTLVLSFPAQIPGRPSGIDLWQHDIMADCISSCIRRQSKIVQMQADAACIDSSDCIIEKRPRRVGLCAHRTTRPQRTPRSCSTTRGGPAGCLDALLLSRLHQQHHLCS